MLDCDKLNKDSCIDDVDYLYRYSMLTPEAEIVYKIVEATIEADAIDLEEMRIDANELKDLQEHVENKLDLAKKALDRIKNLLTEKQFGKIEYDYDKVVEELENIEDELY